MNPALTFLLFRRELLTVPRRRFFYIKRTAFVLASSVYMLFGFSIVVSVGGTTAGLLIFSRLAVVALFALCLMSPSIAALSIEREKEERTLGLLFLSEITAGRFVLGKLLAGIFATLMALLSVLPLFMLVISMGGVSARQIVTAFVVVFAAVLLCSSLGIFSACVMRTVNAGSLLTVFLMIAYFIGLPAAVALPYYIYAKQPPPEELLGMVSPFAAVLSAIRGSVSRPAWINAGLNVVLSLPFLRLARNRVPLLAIETEGVRWRRGSVLARFRAGWLRTAAGPITGNPLTWKDYNYTYGGARKRWLVCAVSVVLISCAVFALPLGRAFERLYACMPAVFVMSLIVVFLGSISAFGRLFANERKAGAFELLLTTALTDDEIVIGKAKAVMLSIMPWVILAVVIGVGLICVHGLDSGAVFATTAELLSTWVAFSALSMVISLRSRRNIAFGVCIGVWLAWNTFGMVPRMALAALCGAHPHVIVLADVLFYGMIGYFSLASLFGSFRRLAVEVGSVR